MFDIKTIKDWTIPEGSVAKVECDGKVLWMKVVEPLPIEDFKGWWVFNSQLKPLKGLEILEESIDFDCMGIGNPYWTIRKNIVLDNNKGTFLLKSKSPSSGALNTCYGPLGEGKSNWYMPMFSIIKITDDSKVANKRALGNWFLENAIRVAPPPSLDDCLGKWKMKAILPELDRFLGDHIYWNDSDNYVFDFNSNNKAFKEIAFKNKNNEPLELDTLIYNDGTGDYWDTGIKVYDLNTQSWYDQNYRNIDITMFKTSTPEERDATTTLQWFLYLNAEKDLTGWWRFNPVVNPINGVDNVEFEVDFAGCDDIVNVPGSEFYKDTYSKIKLSVVNGYLHINYFSNKNQSYAEYNDAYYGSWQESYFHSVINIKNISKLDNAKKGIFEKWLLENAVKVKKPAITGKNMLGTWKFPQILDDFNMSYFQYNNPIYVDFVSNNIEQQDIRTQPDLSTRPWVWDLAFTDASVTNFWETTIVYKAREKKWIDENYRTIQIKHFKDEFSKPTPEYNDQEYYYSLAVLPWFLYFNAEKIS